MASGDEAGQHVHPEPAAATIRGLSAPWTRTRRIHRKGRNVGGQGIIVRVAGRSVDQETSQDGRGLARPLRRRIKRYLLCSFNLLTGKSCSASFICLSCCVDSMLVLDFGPRVTVAGPHLAFLIHYTASVTQ